MKKGKKSRHISLIITPTFASENDYTQTFRKLLPSLRFVRSFLFSAENQSDEKVYALGMRSSNNIWFLRLNSNF